jgi:hypothetical protein
MDDAAVGPALSVAPRAKEDQDNAEAEKPKKVQS